MAISRSKRRYNVSLTPSNVDRFHSLCKFFGMPPGTMSSCIDDFLVDISNVLELGKEQGKLDIDDLQRLMGKQMDLIRDEERKKTDADEKRNTNSN